MDVAVEGGIEQASWTRAHSRRKRADLGHRQELVLVDAEREADMRRGIDQRLARLLEHPEMGDRGSQHDAEFLRLGGAGIVEDAAVGLEQHTRHAHREEMRQRLRHRGLQRLDRHAQTAGAGEDRRRIDAEGQIELCRVGAPLAKECDQPVGHGAAQRMGVDADLDAVERHAVENRFQRLGRPRQAIAERIRRAFEDQRQSGRALRDVFQRLALGAAVSGSSMRWLTIHAQFGVCPRRRLEP